MRCWSAASWPKKPDRRRHENRDHESMTTVQPGAALYGLESHLQGKVVTFGGGYPLWRDGQLIAGLGISGGSVEQDMAIAQAAMAAINVRTHQ